MKKFRKWLALGIILPILSLTSCATGQVKKAGYVGTVATTQALGLIQDTEMELAAEGVIDPALHKKINGKLVEAFKVNIAAIDAFAALPPHISTPTAEVLSLVAKVWALIDEIRALFPGGKTTEALSEKLEAVRKK